MVQDYRLLGSNSFLNHFISLEKINSIKSYKHFDSPVPRRKLLALCNESFCKRSFYPMIKIEKTQRKIIKNGKKIEVNYKTRKILYASHTDALIYKFVGFMINSKLEQYYEGEKISGNIAAYRMKSDNLHLSSNYDWASFVYERILEKIEKDKRINSKNSLCVITADVKDFFGKIDHYKLREKMQNLMKFNPIPDDWYIIFKNVTKFAYIEKTLLEKFSTVPGENRFSISKLKKNGIKIQKNLDSCGIPQGNPISSTLSNLYMIDFDKKVSNFCAKRNISYIRYSDDIIFICRQSQRKITLKLLRKCIKEEKLTLEKRKTRSVLLNKEKNNSFDYLGFTIYLNGAVIRAPSINKMFRKFQKNRKIAFAVAKRKQDLNISDTIYTKKLYRKFSTISYYNHRIGKKVYADNFFSYARRSARSFKKVGGDNISDQINKAEKKISNQIKMLKKELANSSYNEILHNLKL